MLHSSKTSVKKKSIKDPKISTIVRNDLFSKDIDYTKYTYEFMWCGILSVAIVFFIKGRSANDNIANGFNKGIAEAISSNFAHFGT